MNRRYKFYYRNALKQSGKAIIVNKGHLKYYIYLLIEMLARLTLIFSPLISLSNIALAKEIKNNGKVNPFKALSSSNTFKSFWAIVLAGILKFLMFLAGLIIFALLTAALGAIGLAIASLSNSIQPAACAILFALPGMIATVVYCIVYPIFFSPVTYIIETNPDLGYGKAMEICYKAMKEKGFFTYLAILLWPTLLNVAFAIVNIAIGAGLILMFQQSKGFIFFAIVIAMIVVSALVYFLPILDLTTRTAHVWLLDDIIDLQEKEVVQSTRGIYVKDFKSDKVGIENIKNNLIRLFDNTSDLDNEIEEETNTEKEDNNLNQENETSNTETNLESKEEVIEENVEVSNDETLSVEEEQQLPVEEEIVKSEEVEQEEEVQVSNVEVVEAPAEEEVETPVEEIEVTEDKSAQEEQIEEPQVEETNNQEQEEKTETVEEVAEQTEAVSEESKKEEPVVEEVKKTRKPRAKKTDASEEVTEKKTRKPRAKKVTEETSN